MKFSFGIVLFSALSSSVEAGGLRANVNLGFVESTVVLENVPDAITCTMCPDDDSNSENLKSIVSSAYVSAYNQHHPGNKMTNADVSFSIEKKPDDITCTMCPDDDASSKKGTTFVMGLVAPVSMITCTMCPDDDSNLQLIKMDAKTKTMVQESFNGLLKKSVVGSVASIVEETVSSLGNKKATNKADKSLVKSSILLSDVDPASITCTMCPDDDSRHSFMNDKIKEAYLTAFEAVNHAKISEVEVFFSKPESITCTMCPDDDSVSNRVVVDIISAVSMITCTMCPDDDAAFGADFHMDAVQKLFEKNMKMKAVFLN